ncbi:hypothetical protein [Brachybacterium sp. NBEC-018]|nr:hypothetical protein [Brachybacterium sp. NBEC-018]
MTTDPTPWLHENGSRYDECHHAPPGALFWMPRPEYTTEKETTDA